MRMICKFVWYEVSSNSLKMLEGIDNASVLEKEKKRDEKKHHKNNLPGIAMPET